MEDLLSPELIGGQDDSLLPTPDVMVVPGQLADTGRPVLLAVTKGWSGKDSLSFAKLIRHVKARLTESRGGVKVVIVFCDTWDSASFQVAPTLQKPGFSDIHGRMLDREPPALGRFEVEVAEAQRAG